MTKKGDQIVQNSPCLLLHPVRLHERTNNYSQTLISMNYALKVLNLLNFNESLFRIKFHKEKKGNML